MAWRPHASLARHGIWVYQLGDPISMLNNVGALLSRACISSRTNAVYTPRPPQFSSSRHALQHQSQPTNPNGCALEDSWHTLKIQAHVGLTAVFLLK